MLKERPNDKSEWVRITDARTVYNCLQWGRFQLETRESSDDRDFSSHTIIVGFVVAACDICGGGAGEMVVMLDRLYVWAQPCNLWCT